MFLYFVENIVIVGTHKSTHFYSVIKKSQDRFK